MNKCAIEGGIVMVLSGILIALMISLIWDPMTTYIIIFLSIIAVAGLTGAFFLGLYEVLEALHK